MRKLEVQMNDAINNQVDWKSANTKVLNYDGVSEVYLHGNLIAKIGETWMQLFDAGYQTHTTKSRINALLSAHGVGNEYVFQKNFQWFLNYEGGPIPFFDGMKLN